MVRALISLGTNTTRLLVVRERGDGTLEQLEHGAIGTRLGEGLREGGSLHPQAIARNLAAIEEFVARARAHGAQHVFGIATSAMRRASDSPDFARRVEASIGGELVVLGGPDEAKFGFYGAMLDVARDGERRGLIDIGGGSTESAVGCGLELESTFSVELGSVALTERVPGLNGSMPGAPAFAALEEARAIARESLAGLDAFKPVVEVRAVAGTPMTLAAVARESTLEATAGTQLECNEVERVLAKLLALDLPARRALPGMIAQRADIIVAGGVILGEVMERFGVARVTVEVNDLLLGYLAFGIARDSK